MSLTCICPLELRVPPVAVDDGVVGATDGLADEEEEEEAFGVFAPPGVWVPLPLTEVRGDEVDVAVALERDKAAGLGAVFVIADGALGRFFGGGGCCMLKTGA